MHDLYQRIEAASATRGTVLIVGESGTGKEWSHARCTMRKQAAAPFVALNCAAIPKDLIESELFGHKRGAFSGRTLNISACFAPPKGSLFLDEVTEMSPETQSKLLRAIQERRAPVGSTRIAHRRTADCLDHRDPEEACEPVICGRSYYRLQASEIRLPPLRERLEMSAFGRAFHRTYNERMLRPRPMPESRTRRWPR